MLLTVERLVRRDELLVSNERSRGCDGDGGDNDDESG